MSVVRVCKVLLLAAMAFFFTLVVFNNTTDFDSNYQFVRHGVLSRDYCVGGDERSAGMVGGLAAAEGGARDGGGVCAGKGNGDCRADERDVAVVCGVSVCGGGVVLDVAVEDLEWAGGGVQDVCRGGDCAGGVDDEGVVGA
jgi:hypothetical protein